MSNSKFSKPLAVDPTREKKLEAFLNPDAPPVPAKIKLVKENTKAFTVRLPQSLWDDIHELMARSGLTINALCVDILRPEVKRKLKELKAE